ncbi:MAG: hypothetical protein M1825_003478 [Sarcosagium campestre]|nr:MAG: hypothetical protein M1825_003478 [Sarcosagium campestre]
MASVDSQRNVWRLSIDTSTSASSNSSSNSSPTREYAARGVPKGSQQLDWRHAANKTKSTGTSTPPIKISVPEINATVTAPTAIRQPSSQSIELSVPGGALAQHGLDQGSADGVQNTDIPSVEETFRTRSTSISFNPKVTLDTGIEMSLDIPVLPPDVSQNVPGPRVRSTTNRLKDPPVAYVPLKRTQSESEKTRYDSVTGQLMGPRSRGVRTGKDKIRLPAGHARHPLLQSTVERLARNPLVDDNTRRASLTSESTVSPTVEEAPTPTESPVEFTLSPLATSSPFLSADALKSAPLWPAPRLSPTTRAKSLTFAAQGLKSRRGTSRRSSSSLSPAGAFLSGWGANAVAARADADDEGQEIGPYVIGKQIGFGGFSVVKEAFTIEGDVRIARAVKIVRRRVAGRDEQENEILQANFEHEVSLWRCLNHRYVLPLLAVFEHDFATFCITPLHNRGTLFDLIRTSRHGLTTPLIKRYAFQLASALRYLHEDAQVVHRDVKLENCLLDFSDQSIISEGGNIVLCDFGMAESVSSSPPARRVVSSADRQSSRNIGPSDTSTSIVGSLQYASPESITSSTSLYSTAVDLWAYGVVVYALATGDLPFRHSFQPRLVLTILKEEWDEQALRNCPSATASAGADADADALVALVRGCLSKQPELRWDVRRVLGCELLHGLDAKLEPRVEGGWKL